MIKSVIEKRRSIRNFNKIKIDKKLVEDIIECGRMAPSAKDRQPWYFFIVEEQIKNKIADVMLEYGKNNNLNIEEQKNKI